MKKFFRPGRDGYVFTWQQLEKLSNAKGMIQDAAKGDPLVISTHAITILFQIL